MDKIYTKAGDDGFTATACGKMVLKNEPCIELVGTVDEVFSFLGIAKLLAKGEVAEDIEFIQQKLTLLMGKISKEEQLRDEEIALLENMCDKYSDEKLDAFVMLDNNILSAHLNYARALTRRAERIACTVCAKKRESKSIIAYLNRLSDLLFSMARSVNE